MRKLILPLFLLSVALFSCKKNDTPQQTIAGQWLWTIQYANNPAYNSTPQSTGINETIAFGTNGTFSLTRNNVIVNTGTYKTSTALSSSGEVIPTVLYTNSRVTDSVAYYKLVNNSDSLIFSHDFIGTVGSGARYYGRQN
jgi:hypothetical protein